MRIGVVIEGFEAARARLLGKQKQVRFAAVVAITRTANDVKQAVPAALSRDLDRPTRFTLDGTFVTRADRDRLEAVVGFKDRQAKYMQLQIAGGLRQPGSRGIKLPSAIQLNEFGNIPRGVIGKLLAVARKEGALTKRVARRVRISRSVELFFGDPKDQGGRKFPRGIYKDVDLGGGRRQLIPLIVFPQRPAKYRPRFNFQLLAGRVVRESWPRNFNAALADALRTAR